MGAGQFIRSRTQIQYPLRQIMGEGLTGRNCEIRAAEHRG